MQLERHQGERSRAQRDVGRDVGLVRILGPQDDEATLEIEELAREVGAERVDEQRGPRERVVGEAQEGPRGEPGEAPLTEGYLEPQDRCTSQGGERGPATPGQRSGRRSGRASGKASRKALEELVPQSFEGGRGHLDVCPG